MQFYEAVSLAQEQYDKDFDNAWRDQNTLEDKENDILIVFYKSPSASAYVIENYNSANYAKSVAIRIYPKDVPIEE